jgi:hypothetical protein
MIELLMKWKGFGRKWSRPIEIQSRYLSGGTVEKYRIDGVPAENRTNDW